MENPSSIDIDIEALDDKIIVKFCSSCVKVDDIKRFDSWDETMMYFDMINLNQCVTIHFMQWGFWKVVKVTSETLKREWRTFPQLPVPRN